MNRDVTDITTRPVVARAGEHDGRTHGRSIVQLPSRMSTLKILMLMDGVNCEERAFVAVGYGSS